MNRKPGIVRHEARRRPSEEPSTFVSIRTDRHRAQVYISPSGRVVRFYLDGKELTVGVEQ